MREQSDRYRVQPFPPSTSSPKQLGGYLMEAGLLTSDQIKVALNDQQATGMRFGEIIVARGWLKEQTIEWIVEKVVEPERKLIQTASQASARSSNARLSNAAAKTRSQRSSGSQSSRLSDALSADAVRPDAPPAASSNADSSSPASQKPATRREVPISKPLPPVKSSDGEVNWVG